jgi:Carboxypeptidase regulatory-like domain
MKFRVLIFLAAAVATSSLSGYVGAQTTPRTTDEEIGATKLGSITGRVVADGQPVINAVVSASRLNSAGPARAVPVNDNGDFEIKGLESGVYRVTAAASAYVTSPAESDTETYYRVGDSVALRLIKGGVITGKVLTADDAPVIAVRVRASMIRDTNGKPPVTPGPSLEQTTDDRGSFRIFGLSPGTYVVSSGGRGPSGYGVNAFDNDAPTYAPSSTRDTAAEIVVAGGEEKTVNIHYRGDVGHAVSGNAIVASTPNTPWINIYLARLVDDTPDVRMSTSQNTGARGFEFKGVADGEYLIWAQYAPTQSETLLSDPKRISVKATDVTGIELSAKPLATVAGELILESSKLEVCKEKRRPVFDETLITIERKQKGTPREQPQLPLYRTAQAAPDSNGKFLLRNLGAGQYRLDVRFFARYWFFRSIKTRAATATPATQINDAAPGWLALKAGDRLTGVTLILSEGAASLNGQVEAARDEKLPTRLSVFLLPAEKESSNDVLRFFTARVEADGSFTFDHLPPGRYRALAKAPGENEPSNNADLRLSDAAGTRLKLSREAEAARFEVELQPCQNVSDYHLNLKSN